MDSDIQPEIFIMEVEWGGNTSIMMEMVHVDPVSNTATHNLFVLSGAPLPANPSPAELDALFASATLVRAVTDLHFGPGNVIDFSDLPGVTTSTDGYVEGTDGDNYLSGTSGDDVILPGHNTSGDIIELTPGQDVIDLSGAVMPDGYSIVSGALYSWNGGMDFWLDAEQDYVDITASNTAGDTAYTAIAGLQDALLGDGLNLYGSAYGDWFDFRGIAGGFLSIRAEGGNDSFYLSGAGTVRLNYTNSPEGIVANLATGVIEDGFNYTDTLTVEGSVIVQLRASYGADSILGSQRDEVFILETGADTLDGGGGTDTLRYDRSGVSGLVVNLATGTATGQWGSLAFTHTIANIDVVRGSLDSANRITGSAAAERLVGGALNDTLAGGAGDDTLLGGTTAEDLRDLIYGGDGNDSIDGGYGNDELRGDGGDDAIEGYFGSDTIIGGTGNDTISGSALSDQLFGGEGNDFLNGGFGHDRMNGGAGADRFYHLGIANHGSDWVQDYNGAEDTLVFGNAAATRSQFQINYGTTVGAGDGAVQEAFVVYRPTGQVIWALVDGAGQDHIWLQIGAATYDLMA